MGHAAGFTLVEILVVMLITSVLVLGIHAAYQQAYQLWSRAEDSREAWHQARVLTETLREELGGLYLPLKETEGEEDMQDMAPVFRLSSGPGEAVTLSFFTLSPAWHSDAAFSRMAHVCYRFDRDPDTGGTVLERRETLCAGGRLIGTETSEVLTEDWSGFKVWVLAPQSDASSGSWDESYQSDNQPPAAVRVWFRWRAPRPENPASAALEFESTVAVPCEGPLVSADH